ncbi:MAG TPA: hypothetical protein DD729_03265, partial [Rhodobacteraceae bacterium]|nr:hypothetical protein [Paracoccaceae bacterium]
MADRGLAQTRPIKRRPPSWVNRLPQKAGGETFGVIPEHLLELEVGKRDLSQFIVTGNMHERKKVMYMNSDAIVVLPGGAGSLDELFEV